MIGKIKQLLELKRYYHNGTHKSNCMLIISSREFRQNQRKYFEKVDNGEHIIVQRGKDKSYALTPVSEDDLYFNAEMVQRIKQSILQAEQGKLTRVASTKEINDLLGL